jgi:hypothetical protein
MAVWILVSYRLVLQTPDCRRFSMLWGPSNQRWNQIDLKWYLEILPRLELVGNVEVRLCLFIVYSITICAFFRESKLHFPTLMPKLCCHAHWTTGPMMAPWPLPLCWRVSPGSSWRNRSVSALPRYNHLIQYLHNKEMCSPFTNQFHQAQLIERGQFEVRRHRTSFRK